MDMLSMALQENHTFQSLYNVANAAIRLSFVTFRTFPIYPAYRLQAL